MSKIIDFQFLTFLKKDIKSMSAWWLKNHTSEKGDGTKIYENAL